MTNEEHNKYVAYSFLGYAAFQTFWLVLMLAWFAFIFGSIAPAPGPGNPPLTFIGIFLVIMLVFQLVFTAPAVVAAYAMLKRKPWAKIAAIIGAVMSAMSVPVGTAACIYAMWFWMGDNWKGVYPEQSLDRTPERADLGPADDFRSTDNFTREQNWMKQPPDWR